MVQGKPTRPLAELLEMRVVSGYRWRWCHKPFLPLFVWVVQGVGARVELLHHSSGAVVGCCSRKKEGGAVWCTGRWWSVVVDGIDMILTWACFSSSLEPSPTESAPVDEKNPLQDCEYQG